MIYELCGLFYVTWWFVKVSRNTSQDINYLHPFQTRLNPRQLSCQNPLILLGLRNYYLPFHLRVCAEKRCMLTIQFPLPQHIGKLYVSASLVAD